MRTGGGEWLDVNVGEIPEFASRAHYRATPHRVVNRSSKRSRVFHPFFLNPGLASAVEWAPVKAAADRGHIHRVFPGMRQEVFVFGQQTVATEGPDIWCSTCVSG